MTIFLEDYLLTSFANNRSSKRTDDLNVALLNEFLNEYPEYAELEWKFEIPLPDAYGATFKVDAVGFEGDTPKIVLLNKNANSNFAQNMKNYANTSVGEAARVLLGPIGEDVEKVFFITVHPNYSPFFKSDGSVSRIENVWKAKKRTNVESVLKKLYGSKVSTITYSFDINEINEFSTKTQFQDGITISNLNFHQCV
ncbi:hypothetical protein Syn7803C25_94 [Synechococcus phage ACG-2014f]|uniref:Uncharacterized protein n=1 Tax=Synechococcus phage ACG-2014f TaxID=1493511 RepID=A0A0E3I6V1_9CAUD|nr:hypothetical protein Syn7803C25_94 [Synechococcus phage ACG-2014f]